MNPIEIIADYRENHSSVWEYLSALPDVHLRWKDLSIGDYLVEKGAIFERKTASDFAASLIDQRLFSQARRLAEQPLRAGFIMEGGPGRLEYAKRPARSSARSPNNIHADL